VKTVGVVTVARSDYGIYRPVLRRIAASRQLRLSLYAAGMHLSKRFGLTVQEIEADGFRIAERVPMSEDSDSPAAIARSMSRGIEGFARLFARSRPDILMLLGDRFEMLTAAAAALPFTLPIAHIHGGETTFGAIDEAIRHSLTKMSHLHFVSTAAYRRRVIQLGEEPWRVTLCGAPGLDNVRRIRLLDRAGVERAIGMSLSPSPLLVTFHPVTLEYLDTEKHVSELMAALERIRLPVVFTYPNADTAGRKIVTAIRGYTRTHRDSRAIASLGTQAYFSLMKHAAAMVGNSSSGIIEAASFGLPVVDIGSRQGGRVHGRNVIHSDCERAAIAMAARKAIAPAFRRSLRGLPNPYGDGRAAGRIVRVLERSKLDRRLLMKRFYDADS
jgi:UDP-hydrolysing UDP-N-acetyl-D-glucosamine 2-epimerase